MHILRLLWARLTSNSYAGVTQLVECNLAKVDVASSNLVSRSIPHGFTLPTVRFYASFFSLTGVSAIYPQSSLAIVRSQMDEAFYPASKPVKT